MSDTTPPRTDGSSTPRPRGLLCPRCAVRLVTSVTRPATAGMVVRYVHCKKCNLRARSEEKLTRVFEAE